MGLENGQNLRDDVYEVASGERGYSAQETDRAFSSLQEKISTITPNSPENIIAVTDILESVNLNTIHNAFRRRYAEIPHKKSLNFISKDRIFVLDSNGIQILENVNKDLAGLIGASLKDDSNSILVNADFILNEASRLDVNPTAVVYHMLAHEQTHALTGSTCNSVELRTVFAGSQQSHNLDLREQRIGLSKIVPTLTWSHANDKTSISFSHAKLFGVFDEGLTEKVAREVLGLMIRDGQGLSLDANLMQEYETKSSNQNYAHSVYLKFVNLFLRKISKDTGMDEKRVMDGMIHAQMHSMDLVHPEVMEIFEDVLGKGFMGMLMNASSPQDLDKIVQKFNLNERRFTYGVAQSATYKINLYKPPKK